MEAVKASLFERIGGDAAISAVVEDFYVQLLMDDHVKGFFDGVDFNVLKRHQKLFLKMAFGGIAPVDDVMAKLSKAHGRLVVDKGLNDSHFDTVAKILEGVLVDFSIDRGLIDEVLTIVEGTRKYVLCKE